MQIAKKGTNLLRLNCVCKKCRKCLGNFFLLKSFSDAVLSQQPSPKNFLQKILSLILTNLDQIHRDLLKNPEKKICKKFIGLDCCEKIASENDFKSNS